MKIAVIAAQGKSGRTFVSAALSAGHQVVAGIRGDDPFDPHPNLATHQCDATDSQQVESLIRGCDAVVTMIGHVPGSPRRVQTDATHVLIEAMKRQNMRRIVSLTGTGARVPGDKLTLLDRLMNFAISKIDIARISDGIEHLEVLRNSGLDFTVVRVLKLTNGLAGPFELTEHGPANVLTSRKEVALAVLDILENNRFIGMFPVISPIRRKG